MSNRERFEDKCGIITGAASGMGRATALHLALAGAGLTLVDQDEVGLDATAREIERAGRARPQTLAIDVSDAAQVERMVADRQVALDRIDFLVNMAGILRRTPFDKIDQAEWDLVMAVNLRGVYLCCRAVLAPMKAQGKGVIVNVASVAGRSVSILGGAHYTAAKHGVVGLTRHLARELGTAGIRVNAFCPGATLTPMIEKTTSEEEQRQLAAKLPLGRFAQPEEQARAIAFMLSDDSSYITGACLDSNGGAIML
jgi:NAD(P)-dependent dehydrogenase (short-subunit alcohol dehydrogenase family)